MYTQWVILAQVSYDGGPEQQAPGLQARVVCVRQWWSSICAGPGPNQFDLLVDHWGVSSYGLTWQWLPHM